MNQQRAATKSVGSRVRQTCGQRGRRVQLAVLESWVKLGSCLTLACLVSTWGRCLTLSFAGEATWDRHARCFPWWEVINKHHDFSTELDAWIALFCEFLQEIPSINQGHTHIHSNSKMIIAHPCFVSLQATMHAVLHVNEDNKKQSRDGPQSCYLRVPTPVFTPFCCLFEAAAVTVLISLAVLLSCATFTRMCRHASSHTHEYASCRLPLNRLKACCWHHSKLRDL